MKPPDQALDRLWLWLAWRLPRGLVYWCAVRLTSERWDFAPDQRKVSEALETWRLNKK